MEENIRSAGLLTFSNRSPKGWILPGFYYLYDLQLPSDRTIAPKTNVVDGEVESFELMDMEVVLGCLLDGQFKSSSALAVIDFMIRHSFITEDSDLMFSTILTSLRTRFDLPMPWSTMY